MIEPEKLYAALIAAGIPVVGCTSEGLVYFSDNATAAQRAIGNQISEAFPTEPFMYDGVAVWDAVDVDRVTVARIYDLVAPGQPRDLQQTAETRMMKDAMSANATLIDPNATMDEKVSAAAVIATLRQSETAIEAIRAEGRAFKAEHNL